MQGPRETGETWTYPSMVLVPLCTSNGHGVHPTVPALHCPAFAGCTQLRAVWKKGKSKTWQGTYARPNALTNASN